MPRKRRRKADKADNRTAGRRPVWSGTLSFGLVTMPVELYSTVKSSRTSLRMIGPAGTPLSRRYISQSGELLEAEDIVRGYEVSEDEFVTIEDEELDELDPERSRTIDLDMFVEAASIDPVLVDSSYLLIPQEEAAAAYRLLAASMAASGRAGIARFVLREKAFQVALISNQGSLRALTLRYPDELRTAAEVDLPEPGLADVEHIARFETAIGSLRSDSLDVNLLQDDSAERLEKLVKRKLAAKQDVHRLKDTDEAATDAEDSPVAPDLLEQLRRSLESGSQAR